MTKTKLIFIGLAVALVGFLFAGSASAQEQTVTVDPAVVPEAGTYTLSVTSSGFTVGSANLAVCSSADESIEWGQATLIQYCGGFGSAQTPNSTVTLEDVEITDDGVTLIWFELVADGESGVARVTVGDELPATGVNTSLLVVIGTGIALAGAMVFGLSRRLRTL
ncbi:LPXTG cell wall anchor domain-containing protein [Candidatus Poriferisocius sp.]|uniref:LPXTG cell wall anchor domain-containing protein n=1 Tax=Candidatus Poriferisocius sp. TaxID=3101276 RepID=UPI003B5A7FEA